MQKRDHMRSGLHEMVIFFDGLTRINSKKLDPLVNKEARNFLINLEHARLTGTDDYYLRLVLQRLFYVIQPGPVSDWLLPALNDVAGHHHIVVVGTTVDGY